MQLMQRCVRIYIYLILHLMQFNVAFINVFDLLIELKSIYLCLKFNLFRIISLRYMHFHLYI